jgi:hypothetical protein
VDVDLAEGSVARALEAVRFAGGHDHDVAPGDVDVAVGAVEGGLALEQDADLGIVVRVGRRAASRFEVEDEVRISIGPR